MLEIHAFATEVIFNFGIFLSHGVDIEDAQYHSFSGANNYFPSCFQIFYEIKLILTDLCLTSITDSFVLFWLVPPK